MELDEKQLTALVVNTVREAISAKNAEDEMADLKAKNAELEEKLKGLEGKKGEAENEDGEDKEKEEEKEITAENVKPSQEVVATFSKAFNADFKAKTPSYALLAGLAGIVETDPAKRIAAVNAKYDEIKKASPKDSASASNSTMGVF